jgi:hypothetical protein
MYHTCTLIIFNKVKKMNRQSIELTFQDCDCCEIQGLNDIPELIYNCESRQVWDRGIWYGTFLIEKIKVNAIEKDIFDGSTESDIALIKLYKYIKNNINNISRVDVLDTISGKDNDYVFLKFDFKKDTNYIATIFKNEMTEKYKDNPKMLELIEGL